MHEHLEAGPFGQSACGKVNVKTTRVPEDVTCSACRTTSLYREALHAPTLTEVQTDSHNTH